MKNFFLLLVALVSLASCKGDETPKAIELASGSSTSQIVYADETSKAEGIKFTAQAPWTASVNATKVGVDWLTLSQTSGGAGSFTLGLTLQENKTGANRKAEIRIECGGLTITITVEQKATNKPEEPKPIQGLFITQDGKVTGGEILSNMTPKEVYWEVERMDGNDPGSIVSSNPVSYTNKNFNLIFPTPESKVLGGFMSSEASTKPTITPADTKFAGGFLDCTSTEGNLVMKTELSPTNISIENLRNEGKYLAKKGEGYVRFVYATKEVVIDGLLNYPGDVQTFRFSNCKFRQGWNEIMMVADENTSADGKVTINISTNNATSDFKWVALRATEDSHGDMVMKINDKIITYNNLNGEDEVFGSYGDLPYLNKRYSGTEWAYLSADVAGNQNDWECYFQYNSNAKVESTKFKYTSPSSDLITQYRWNGDKLTAVFDIDYGEGRGMRLDIEYGDTEYTKGNVDINWLIANDDHHGNRSFCTPEESAIGVRSVAYNKLISKIVQKDNNGNDKYSATITYRYEFDSKGYITTIYKSTKYLLSVAPAEERLRYKFTYFESNQSM